MAEEPKKESDQLPEGIVEKDDQGGFTVRLDKLRSHTLYDQVSISKEGIGCFNNPGGPTC